MAIRIAGKLRLSTAGPALFNCLKDPTVKWDALSAFAETADVSFREAFSDYVVKTPIQERSYLHYQVLARLGAREAAPALIDALAFAEQREHAAKALADLGVHQAFEPICSLIPDKNNGFRYAGYAARLAQASDVDYLLKSLEPHYPEQIYSLWGGLSSLQDFDACRVVIDRFQKEARPKIREHIFSSTKGSMMARVPEGVALLKEIASHPEQPFAFDASIVLLSMKGPEVLPIVEEAMRKAERPGWPDIALLKNYPSDRMVETMERLARQPETGGSAVDYLEALGTPAARQALTRIAHESKHPLIRHAAAGALAWSGGEARDVLAQVLIERTANSTYSAPQRLGDLIEADEPGLREELRRQVKAQGIRPFFSLLARWAHPEMEDELRKLWLASCTGRNSRISKEDLPMGFCQTGEVGDATGWQAVEALAATGDRSLLPLFMELLRDAEPGIQSIAIRTLGRWRAREAVPPLRQLVRSGGWSTRFDAIRALASIGAPGTAEFLKEHLRDNPDAVAHALARLGVDARSEVKALLVEQYDDSRLLGALDLMANPTVYARIDQPLPRQGSRRVAELPALIERLTGVPARLSDDVRDELTRKDLLWYDWTARTLRDALDTMGWYSNTLRLYHVYRDGAIEICKVDEARRFWAQAK